MRLQNVVPERRWAGLGLTWPSAPSKLYRRHRRDTACIRSIVAYTNAADRAGLNYRFGDGPSLGILFHLAESHEGAVHEIAP